MTRYTKEWESEMDDLLCEILASKEAYKKLAETEKYPNKNTFFRNQVEQRQSFAKVLTDELYAIKNGVNTQLNMTENRIFDPLVPTVLKGRMTEFEVDRLILRKEQELIEKYQGVLVYEDIPNTTDAILQAQAEEINNTSQKLQLNLNIDE